MLKTVWFTRKYICKNGIEERTKYPVRIDADKIYTRESSRRAKKASRAVGNAEKSLARLLNNNFEAKRDYHIVLEYDEGGMQRLYDRALKNETENFENDLYFAAQRELLNFIRRVQRSLKGKAELKYIAVTSDLDGESGEPARIHHHLVVNAEALEVCLLKWGRGFVHTDELYAPHGDFSPLASYMIKQVRFIPNAKRYTPSRNLEQPIVTEPLAVTRYAESEMRTPTGCITLYRAPYVRGNAQYLRYYRPKKE